MCQCQSCNEELEEDASTVVTTDGDVCEQCYSDLYATCEYRRCGDVVLLEDMHTVDNGSIMICDSCHSDHYTTCCVRGCNVTMHNNDAVTHRGNDYCRDCYHEQFTDCYRCDTTISNDDTYNHDDEQYCSSCYNEVAGEDLDGLLHSYGYKPDAIFHHTSGVTLSRPKDGEIYYGLELEVQRCPDRITRDFLQSLQDALPNAYFKEDGSLDDGFEIVTHPGTFAYHSDRKGMYTDAFKSIREFGLKTSECGLHIHVSRTAFADLDHLTQFCFMVERWEEELFRFSRRDRDDFEKWTNVYGCRHDKYEMKKKVENQSGQPRYRAVNLNNAKTVEIRLFRSTLNPTKFFAALQLIQALVKASKIEKRDIHWNQFVAFYCKAFPELTKYLADMELTKIPYVKPAPINKVAPVVKPRPTSTPSRGAVSDDPYRTELADQTIQLPEDYSFGERSLGMDEMYINELFNRVGRHAIHDTAQRRFAASLPDRVRGIVEHYIHVLHSGRPRTISSLIERVFGGDSTFMDAWDRERRQVLVDYQTYRLELDWVVYNCSTHNLEGDTTLASCIDHHRFWANREDSGSMLASTWSRDVVRLENFQRAYTNIFGTDFDSDRAPAPPVEYDFMSSAAIAEEREYLTRPIVPESPVTMLDELIEVSGWIASAHLAAGIPHRTTTPIILGRNTWYIPTTS